MGNVAERGSAIHVSKATLTAQDCIVTDSSGASRGGGLWFYSSESVIERCVFAHNQAQWGPAIEVVRSVAEISRSTFYGNVAERNTGTIRSLEGSTLTIDASILVSNLGASAVSCESSSATLHCTDVYGNEGGDWVVGMSQAALEEQFRRAVFNVVGCNQDDHVKNFAFMMDRGGNWDLAPAYDLCHAEGSDFTRNHQLSINGKTHDFAAGDIQSLAAYAGLPQGRGQRVLERTREAFSAWAALAEDLAISPARSPVPTADQGAG